MEVIALILYLNTVTHDTNNGDPDPAQVSFRHGGFRVLSDPVTGQGRWGSALNKCMLKRILMITGTRTLDP